MKSNALYIVIVAVLLASCTNDKKRTETGYVAHNTLTIKSYTYYYDFQNNAKLTLVLNDPERKVLKPEYDINTATLNLFISQFRKDTTKFDYINKKIVY